MRTKILASSCAFLLAGCALVGRSETLRAGESEIEVWLTLADQSALLAEQPSLHFVDGAPVGDAIIVNPRHRYQPFVGFGAAITDASAFLIQNKLDEPARQALLKDLFGPAPGVGFSFTRIVIGASDFSTSHYSFDDRPPGETDPDLAHFTIEPAQREVLPVLRAAREINPELTVMASPWSAPGWMKTTDSLIQGTLREDAYAPFAAYLRRTVEAFAAQGAPVDYISIQNEPDFEPGNYPGMRLSAEQRARIIGAHVGPEFERAGLETKILEWDHNWSKPEQPLGVLADADAARFISGVAWHCYEGEVAAQTPVREQHPDMDVFFTECSGGEWSRAWPDAWAWTMRNLVIGATRNWARGVLLWNLALDENHGPHLGGCGNCRGIVTIDSRTGAVTRSPEYYALGHVSRFVPPGARRIASTSPVAGVESAAFITGNESRVLVAFNTAAEPVDLVVEESGRHFRYTLASNAAATFRWRKD